MTERERKLAMVVGVAVLILMLDFVVLMPYLDGSKELQGKINAARVQRTAGRVVIQHGPRIRSDWEGHRARAPKGTKSETQRAFQQDLLRLFKKARIETKRVGDPRDVERGEVKEIVFTVKIEATTTKDLSRLMRTLDGYDGYLRANMLKVTRLTGKRKGKLDVTIDVSTIWFSVSNGGRS